MIDSSDNTASATPPESITEKLRRLERTVNHEKMRILHSANPREKSVAYNTALDAFKQAKEDYQKETGQTYVAPSSSPHRMYAPARKLSSDAASEEITRQQEAKHTTSTTTPTLK
ncbi:MAG: hypothetical protein P1U61_07665 [Legionellaceae bacterium]|nr:hypothetical protein [Legionellaceae bacterium]